MSHFGRSECGLFASKNVAAHLVRGAIAAGLITWAFLHQVSHPALAIGSVVVAVVAMRGCPACWTVGLFETIGQSVARSIPARRHNSGSRSS